MSSTGVRDQTSIQERAIRALVENDKSFVESLKPFGGGPTGGTVSQLAGTTANSPGSPAGNFLPITGGIMTGFLALRVSDIFMLNNVIDLSAVDNQSSRLVVTGEGAANDDVEFFNLPSPLSDTIFSIQGVIGIDLTFINQTATVAPDVNHRKIRTFDGTDLVLSGNQNVLAFYDVSADEIVLLSAAAGAGGGANTFLSNLTSPTAVNQDLNMGTNNVLGAQTYGFVAPGININSTGLQLIFNNIDAAGQDFLFKFGANEAMEITRGGNISFRDSILDEAFSLAFTNGAGISNSVGVLEVNSGGAGSVHEYRVNGIAEMTLSGTALGLVGNNINAVGHMRMNEIATPTQVANTVHVYAKDDAGVSKLFYLQDDGTEVGPLVDTLGAAGANTALSNLVATSINQSLVPNLTSTRNLGSGTFFWAELFTDKVTFQQLGISILGNASGMDFDVNVNDDYEFRINGVQEFLMSGTVLDVVGKDIINVDDIIFDQGGQEIRSNTDGIEFRIPTGDSFEWLINGVELLDLKAAANQLDFLSTTTIINVPLVDFSTTGQFITSDAGGLTYTVPNNDTHDFVVDGSNRFVIDEDFVSLPNNNKVQPISGDIGFFVSATGVTVGTLGTIELPSTTSALLSAADADTRFGATFGACGVHDSGFVLTLYIRQNNGDWSALSTAGNTYGALI